MAKKLRAFTGTRIFYYCLVIIAQESTVPFFGIIDAITMVSNCVRIFATIFFFLIFFSCGTRPIEGKLGQNPGCWCHCIAELGFVYVDLVSSWRIWVMVRNTCVFKYEWLKSNARNISTNGPTRDRVLLLVAESDTVDFNYLSYYTR